MRDSFVFYESFRQILELLDDAEDWKELLNGVFSYVFDGKDGFFTDPKLQIAFTHFKISIDGASARYEKAVEDGKKGGRPSKQDFIPPDVWIAAIEEHGSVPKAAKSLGLATNTLRNWINMSNDERVQKLKNLSVSVSVSDSVSESESDKRKRIKNAPDAPTTDPNGSPSRPATKRKTFEEMWVPPD